MVRLVLVSLRFAPYWINKALKRVAYKQPNGKGFAPYWINKALKLLYGCCTHCACFAPYWINKALKPQIYKVISEPLHFAKMLLIVFWLY